MSFSERLDGVQTENSPISGKRKCTLAKAYSDSRLSEKDQQRLQEAVESPKGHPARVPSSTIVLALRDEGIHVSTTMIDRHRKTICGCYAPEKQE
jgi:hypothetical protein